MNKTLHRYGLTKDPFSKDVPVDELYEYPGADSALKRLKATVEFTALSAVAAFAVPRLLDWHAERKQRAREEEAEEEVDPTDPRSLDPRTTVVGVDEEPLSPEV